MKISHYHALILLLGLIITGILTQSYIVSQVATKGEKTLLVEQATFSPRQYCRSTGGQVTETTRQHVYLCCYAEKNKCIATDTQSSVSWITN